MPSDTELELDADAADRQLLEMRTIHRRRGNSDTSAGEGERLLLPAGGSAAAADAEDKDSSESEICTDDEGDAETRLSPKDFAAATAPAGGEGEGEGEGAESLQLVPEVAFAPAAAVAVDGESAERAEPGEGDGDGEGEGQVDGEGEGQVDGEGEDRGANWLPGWLSGRLPDALLGRLPGRPMPDAAVRLHGRLRRQYQADRAAFVRNASIGAGLAVAFVLLAVLLPVSFVGVEFDELALRRSRLTGSVDKSRALASACYLAGPDAELLRFPATVLTLHLPSVHCHTASGLSYDLTVAVLYRLRPAELGQLYGKLARDYEPVLLNSAVAALQRTAVHVSLDTLRTDRATAQRLLLQAVYAALTGACCPPCCAGHECDGQAAEFSVNCSRCDSSPQCRAVYHVDVLALHLMDVNFHTELSRRMLQATLFGIKAETAKLELEHAGVVMDRRAAVQRIAVVANEAASRAAARANRTRAVAAAAADKMRIVADAAGFQNLTRQLSGAGTKTLLSVHYLLCLQRLADRGRLVVANATSLYAAAAGGFQLTDPSLR